jgi:hypothetical protein
MSRRGGKRSRPLGRSAAAIAAQALPKSGRDAGGEGPGARCRGKAAERRRCEQPERVARVGREVGKRVPDPGNALSEESRARDVRNPSRAREAAAEKPREGKAAASLRARIAEPGLIGRPPLDRDAALTDPPNSGWASWREYAVGAPIGRSQTRPGQAEETGGASGSVEAQAPSEFVLVHDRVGVAVRDAGVVRQPVRAFVAAQERRAGFEAVEPLSEVTSGNDRDTCKETTVQIR